MPGKNKRHSGFFLTEMTVSLTLLAMLLSGLALSLHGVAKFNHYQLVRQKCIAAAQAQLESIAATGSLISDDDIAGLWSNISVSTEKSPGVGQWSSMELVEVTAVGKSFRKEVKIRLSRYLPTRQPTGDGK